MTGQYVKNELLPICKCGHSLIKGILEGSEEVGMMKLS
jgi:hypothetical protein